MSIAGRPEIVEMLEIFYVHQSTPSISGSADVDALLLKSAHDGDISGVKDAIKAGANCSVVDGRGMRPIIWAALRGHVEIIRVLLANGAGVDELNTAEWTPLMEASMEGHHLIVKLLIEEGANVNAETNVSGTALMFASIKGHVDIVKQLLEKGADPSISIDGTKDAGMTALDYACQKEHSEVIRLLRIALE